PRPAPARGFHPPVARLGRATSNGPSARFARAGARAPASRSEKLQTVDELAARDPPEPAALDDLDVCRRRAVLDMLAAVLREPGAHVVLRVEARDAFSVDEESVLRHQPPAVA